MAIQRLNYFNGQFLRANDFNLEQDYHLSMRRRHNKNAHTPGIVHGLEVVAGTSQVTVKAGMAIDKDGREIVLEADTTLPISATNSNTYVVIALEEKKTDPAVAPDPDKLETRWTETALATVVNDMPAGAVGLAQIDVVAANGAVKLKSDYRRIYSAPVVGGDLTVQGNLMIGSDVHIVGDIAVSGSVNGRAVSADGSKLDDHVANTSNPHGTTAAQIDGSTHNLVTQINDSKGVIADTRIATTIAREARFDSTTGHDHDGTDSKKISPSDLNGVTKDVTAANLNLLTTGPTSDASALHTHTAAQIDGGTNNLVTQINDSKGVIADTRIATTIAREARFDSTTGHDHDGTDSKKISPSDLNGVTKDVTAANLNLLTTGPTSDASALHTHTAAQIDGSTHNLVTQINGGDGVIDDARIATTIAREARFDTTTGHDHDGTDSKKISPSDLKGVTKDVTAANLNVLTAGPTSDAAALHTHPFAPADSTVTLAKLDPATRSRLLRVPLLAQVFRKPLGTLFAGTFSGGIAFDGSHVWVASVNGTVLKIDPATNLVVATVRVRADPWALAFGDAHLWVAHFGKKIVSKINVATNTEVDTISVGSGPCALAVSGDFLWVANRSDNSVSKIRMANSRVVETVPVGKSPQALAVVGSYLWTANRNSNDVSQIDMARNEVVAKVDVGSQPRGLAASTATYLWVANCDAHTVSKVDVGAHLVAETISVPSPLGLAVIDGLLWVGTKTGVRKFHTASNSFPVSNAGLDEEAATELVSGGGFVWVAGFNAVTKIEVSVVTQAQAMATTLRLRPFESRGMAFDGLYLWVAVYGSGQVVKVDSETGDVVQTVPVGTKPHSVVYTGQYIFVTNFDSNSVSKINPLTNEVTTILVGANPAGIAYNAQCGTLWVANSGDNTVSVFYEGDTSVAATYAVGTNPQGVACDHDAVWITSTGGNAVTKRTARVSPDAGATIPVGAAPQNIVFDYSNMWVANTGTNSLSKIPINSRVATSVPLPTGALPSGMCFNGSHLFVACADGVTYRIDVYTDTVTTVNTSLDADRNSPLAFDGVATWVVKNSSSVLLRHLL